MSREADSARLFFALWPDERTRAALQKLQAGLRGRLTRPADLHITLAFLGRQPLAHLPLLENILAGLPQTELPLEIDRLGYFRRNRIAWAGTHAVPDDLRDLQATLAQALEAAGIDFDRSKDFKPHITLARDADPPPDVPFNVIIWRAGNVVLVESSSQGSGSHYRVIAASS